MENSVCALGYGIGRIGAQAKEQKKKKLFQKT